MLHIQIDVVGILRLSFIILCLYNYTQFQVLQSTLYSPLSLGEYSTLSLSLSLPLFPPLPGGLKGVSGVGKDVSSRDVRIEWQAISVAGKATHYTDCFAAFLGSQGQCHPSSVGPLHERSSRNRIHSLVWHYSSARSSVSVCISLKKHIPCRTKGWILISFL